MRLQLPIVPRPSTRRSRRPAAAAVEMALLAPLFAALLLGMAEFGRAVMVKEILSNAARKGCRSGVLPGRDNTALSNDVNAVLTSHKLDITKAAIVTKVNDVAGDVRTAKAGDKISVSVSIPFASASWLGNFLLPDESIGSETLIMMRQ